MRKILASITTNMVSENNAFLAGIINLKKKL